MGRNNLENRSKDINWGFNNTQQVPFKFEILSEQQCRNFELAQGLEMHKLSLTIRLNAKYDVNINDVVVVKGQKYMVITTSESFENTISKKDNSIFSNVDIDSLKFVDYKGEDLDANKIYCVTI